MMFRLATRLQEKIDSSHADATSHGPVLPHRPARGWTLLGAALLLVLAPPGSGAAQAEIWRTEDVPLKFFSVKDLEGRVLESSALAGKVAVVDFWATWCAPCVQELPDLAEYYKKIQGNQNVVFLSFAVTEDRETVAAFVRKRGLPYPVYLADELMGTYNLVGFPTKLIIDLRKGKGVVRYRREGFTPIKSLEEQVERVLNGKP